MKKLFGSLFANAASTTAQQQTTPPLQELPVEHYLGLAVRRCRALTPRGEAVVTEYLGQFAQIPGVPLDAARARAKGPADVALNIRAAELLRAPLSPRRPLATFADELLRDAILQKARYEAVAKMREFCTEMSLVTPNAGNECAWCRANEGKRFPVAEDPNELIERNCTCAPYSSTTFYPAIASVSA